MKKITLLLFALLIAIAASSQDASSIVSSDKELTNKDISFSCPDGSVFSQVPTANSAYYCQDEYTYYLVATNYSATGPFTNLRFWGGDFSGCTLDSTEEFEVTIWDDDPSNGATKVFSGTFDGTTFDTGETLSATRIFQIDIDLGTFINQTSGYIGITKNNPSNCTGFAWMADAEGSGHRLSYDGVNWQSGGADLLFCLSSDEPVPVPITNWALYLSTILIGVFFFFRIRKIL